MKKKIVNYKEQIKVLINDSYISFPSNYHFSKEEAILFLNESLVRIRKNYSSISHIITSVFGYRIDNLTKWLESFNSFVTSNQRGINSLDSYSVAEYYCALNSSSISFFNNYIQYINNLLSMLSNICSSLLSKTKFDPEENAVFVVHGHNEKLKNHLKKKLEKNEYRPIILSSMNDSGITLFEKFEKYANRCTKAVILMTKDDLVKKGNGEYYQARPNVFIEFGYFLNMLEKENIVVICEKGCAVPSDIHGVSYLEYVDDLKLLADKVIDSLKNGH